ncbi:hypothetical protein LQW54_008061 [Pestalotiopsis sp. IQ-011]
MDITCLTQDCLTASEHILLNLHPNYTAINPCTNFDQYVCGGFPLRYSDRSNIEIIVTENEKHEKIVKQLLDGELTVHDPTPDDVKIFTKLTNNYKACMDGKRLRDEHHSGVKNVFGRLKAIFPVSSSDVAANALMLPADYRHLADLMMYANDLGTDILIQFDVDRIDSATKLFLPSIQPAVSTPALAKIDANTIARPLEFLQANDRKHLLGDVLKLDSALADMHVGEPNRFPLEKAESKIPLLSVYKILSKLLPKGYNKPSDIYAIESSFDKMNNLLATTPKAVIQAYVFVKVGLVLEQIFSGSSNTDRWGTCLKHIAGTMPHAAGKMYIDGTYDKHQEPAVMELYNDLRATYAERMNHVEWMTDTVKAAAKDKMLNMNASYLLPEEYPNAPNGTALLAYYADLKVGPSHYSNVLSWMKWSNKQKWNLLVQPLHHQFHLPSYVVNAQYNLDQNYVNLYAGIAMPPFFGTGLPQYINYGTLGMAISHEMTHGFDNVCWKYDGNGDYNPAAWDSQTLAAYEARQRCLVNQFDNYVIHVDSPNQGAEAKNPFSHKNLHINGTLTLQENIADNGAIANAYAAWDRRNTLEPNKNLLLPNLSHLTPAQLFFVSNAQFFCHNNNLNGLSSLVSIDSHAPNEVRIRSIMDNSKDFKAAFKCQGHSPPPACRVW